MNEHIARINGLYKSYEEAGRELEILKGISLDIEADEFLAIQGPSGAGKSTLLHILGGLDNPSRGEVFFEGLNLYKLSEEKRAAVRNQKIGFVFQFYHLFAELNVLENVLLPCLLKSWWERKKAIGYAKSVIGEVGLTERITHKPNELSGGEQQRLAIARALINRPKLLLCDEPTGNLDSDNGQKILGLLKKVNREDKTTVVLVTHDKDIAANSDRIIHLKDGKLEGDK